MMWTTRYRGHYIHGYCGKDECYVSGKYKKRYKSLLAAKQAIGKIVNAEEKCRSRVMFWSRLFDINVCDDLVSWSIEFIVDPRNTLIIASAHDVEMKKFNGWLKSKGLEHFQPFDLEAPS